MRKKSKITTVERAMQTVDGFSQVYKLIEQKTILRNQSTSTFQNYIRPVALVCLHFGRLPEAISEAEINDYLTALAQSPNSPSRSSFKHAVFGLRYYFRHVCKTDSTIDLPEIKKVSKLPIILNHKELRQLFIAPPLLKHRIVLMTIYSAGLRSMEAVNLKLSDIDFERKKIHIRQSKYKKDRIVPLSDYMAKGLKIYISQERPHLWLFNGKKGDRPYNVAGISSIMRSALKRTDIQKEVSTHSLRHSYATHLLEEGVNIVTIKELLGHANITTTMVYLHVAQCPLMQAHSPLDTIYPEQ
jgi:integrase/recombinase XerD